MNVVPYPVSTGSDQASPPDVARAEPRAQKPLRRALGFILREPFFHFMALGALVWLGTAYVQSLDDRYVIHIGPAERQRLAMAYQQQYAQPPTPAQLRELIDRYVGEEIFLREGLALHLDRGDEIVRRRIAQKFAFLQTDLAVPPEPTPTVLEAWFQQNKLRYMAPPQVTFTQVYFSPDRDGDAATEARARQALASLAASGSKRAASLGDSFPGPIDVGALAPDGAERLFGKSDLSQALFAVPTGQWLGPFRSGYGWHLIYVTTRTPPQVPRLEEIRSRVLDDYIEEQRQILNARATDKLRAKYKIVQDGP